MQKNKKNIGLYGGSFDPIHHGHINLAIELQEKCKLDEVWFCPARISPHKLDREPSAADHRLKMLHLALDDISFFNILDYEIQKKGPSFTIDTLQFLLNNEAYKQYNFYLIMANDTISQLHTWRKVDEIIELVPLLIGTRVILDDLYFNENKALNTVIKKSLVKTNMLDISSTNLRDRFKKSLYCTHLLPVKVLDYIYARKLYSTILGTNSVG